METWIEIAGIAIHSPVTALTNLLLTVQCGMYYRRLRNGVLDRTGCWALFFLAMAVTTLGGVPKHGFKHLLSMDLYTAVLWVSCLGSGAAVYFAQHATLVSRRGAPEHWWSPGADGRIDWVGALPSLQGAAYLAAATLWGPEMLLTAGNTAVGLIPVMVAEGRSLRHGRAAGGWTLAGLVASLFTGVVYVGRISVSTWFNHIDLAHVLMGVSFWLMVRGATGAPARSAGRAGAYASERAGMDGLAADLGGRA